MGAAAARKQGVADYPLVAAGAQQYPDGRCVDVGLAEFIVDHRDVETQLPGVLRFELADLQLDDDVPC